MTHPSPKRNMVPKAVLIRSGLVSLTARPVNTAQPRTTVNSARPMTHVFNKAHLTIIRPINNKTTTKNNNFNKRVNIVSDKNVNTARPNAIVNAARLKAVLNAVKGNQVNAVKALACWVWKPKTKCRHRYAVSSLMDTAYRMSEGKENGEMLKESIDKGPFQLKPEITAKDKDGTTDILYSQTVEDLTPHEKLRYDSDIKAVNILLLRLPPGESIHSYYLRYAKVINDMNMIPMSMSNMQINTKFVNHLQLEWSRVVTVAKQARNLHSVNVDQFARKNQASAARVVNTVGDAGKNQPRVIRCYNFKGRGHITKQCTAKKRVKDSEWFKDKMLLAQAQEVGRWDILKTISNNESYDELMSNNNVICYADYMVTIGNDADNYVPPPVQYNDMILFVIEQMKSQVEKFNTNNRVVHQDYLKVTKENVATLQELLEEARALKHLDEHKGHASKFAERIQELLVYISALCPFTQRRVSSTNASGSKPRSNTKNHRIHITPSRSKKNKVEAQPRKSNSSVHKNNHVSDCNANVKNIAWSKFFENVCLSCNECLFSANHDACVVKYLKDVLNGYPLVGNLLGINFSSSSNTTLVIPLGQILTTTIILVDEPCPKLSLRYANARESLSRSDLNSEIHPFNLHDYGIERILSNEELTP
ncbi:hypothetical protein Tco_0341441 [Tanacetum coccineum]